MFVRHLFSGILTFLITSVVMAQSLPKGVYPISGIAEDLPNNDLEPIKDAIGDASIVALGESIHTSGGFYQSKFRLIKYLVEGLGFRAIAFESPWTDALSTQKYVETCSGDSKTAIQGLFRVWQDVSVLHMLEWACDFNRRHPEDKLVFFGFDIQQPWDDAPAVKTYLQEHFSAEADELFQNVQLCAGATYETARSWYHSKEYLEISEGIARSEKVHQQCLLGIAHIEELVAKQPATLQQRLMLVHLGGLRAFEGQMYHQSLSYSTDYDGKLATESRDLGMAETFSQFKDLYAKDKKVIVWAHNFHISTGSDTYDEAPVRVMGYHMQQHYRENYYPIALLGQNVEINWASSIKVPLATSNPDSIEFRLDQLGSNYLFVDLADTDLILPNTKYNWGGEFQLTETTTTAFVKGIPADHYKAVFFLMHSYPMKYVDVGR